MENKNIILGITGGIAAYKSIDLARMLVKKKANVRVVMTKCATKLVNPDLLSYITKNEVYLELFKKNSSSITHIELAKWAEIILICPATAATIGKLSSGIYNDLLSAICSASTAKIIIVPSMNKEMWNNIIVQKNVNNLKEANYSFIDPVEGEQLCGDYGLGRMQTPEKIIELISDDSLKEYNVLVTAGPTVEKIDPVRCITNMSSGKMGYEIARSFKNKGAKVFLITGPTHIIAPKVDKIIKVQTAQDMYDNVFKYIKEFNIFVSAAAISDYTAENFSKFKIKKHTDEISLKLKKTKDILAEVSKKSNLRYIIGFAAETNNIVENAQKKLMGKNLDLIIANKIEENGYPIGSDTNTVLILDKKEVILKFVNKSKREISQNIVELVENRLKK